MDRGAWKAAVHGVAEGRTRLSDFTFTFHFHALEKEMATHSNVLAWRIPGTGEPGGLPSMGLHRVGHDWSDLAATVFSIVAIPVCIPTNSAKSSLFSTPSPALIVCRLFDDDCSDWCEMIPCCGFDLHFCNNERCWASFHVLISHLCVFFGEMPI